MSKAPIPMRVSARKNAVLHARMAVGQVQALGQRLDLLVQDHQRVTHEVVIHQAGLEAVVLLLDELCTRPWYLRWLLPKSWREAGLQHHFSTLRQQRYDFYVASRAASAIGIGLRNLGHILEPAPKKEESDAS